MFDQSWKDKPARTSIENLKVALDRIDEHIKLNSIESVTIIFHGGEPMLLGIDYLKEAFDLIRTQLSYVDKVYLGIQTNGTLMTKEWVNLFEEFNVRVGISLDGYKEINDKARVDFKGKSTFDKVMNAIRLLNENSIQYGVLNVMDLDADPIKMIDWLIESNIDQIDFLFPLYNHENLPCSNYNNTTGYGYGDFLVKAFKYWWDNDFSQLRIRIFEDIIHLLQDGKFTVESLGLSPVRILVIASDGEYQALDSLKSSKDKQVQTNLTIFNSPVSSTVENPLINSRFNKYESLCDECKQCKLVEVCGGGYLPHRFHPQLDYNATSVYCQDLKYFISSISEEVLNVT